jgi:hypothetical protein
VGGTLTVHPEAPPNQVGIDGRLFLNALVNQTIAACMPDFFENKTPFKSTRYQLTENHFRRILHDPPGWTVRIARSQSKKS